jgi:hypothetical protein
VPLRVRRHRRPSRITDRGTQGLLFLTLAAAYVVVQRASIASSDGKVMYSVTRNLVDHFTLRTQPDADYNGLHTPYSSYGIGQSLAMAPGYLLEKWFGVPGRSEFVTLTNPVLIAVTAVLLFRLARATCWSRRVAVATALVFGLLTMAVQATTELFSEPGVALGGTMALLGLIRWRTHARHGPLLTGCGLATTILFRTDSLLLVAVPVLALLPLFIPWQRLRAGWPDLLRLAAPLAAVAGWLAFYNWLRFGHPLDAGYAGQGFGHDFTDGFSALLWRGGKGLFVFNPVLLAAPPGLLVLWRRGAVASADRALVVAIGVLALARPLLYARWDSWYGGTVWGPRFLMPMTALLALPAVLGIRALLRSGPARVVAVPMVGVLLAASAYISVVSVWVPYEQAWNAHVKPRPGDPTDHQAARALREERAREFWYTFEYGHIAGNTRLLTRSEIFPLEHYRDGTTAAGWVAGALFGVGLVTTLVAAGAGGVAPQPGPRRGEHRQAAGSRSADRGGAPADGRRGRDPVPVVVSEPGGRSPTGRRHVP